MAVHFLAYLVIAYCIGITNAIGIVLMPLKCDLLYFGSHLADSLLPHLLNISYLLLLILKHLDGFVHAKLDGSRRVPHIVYYHVHEDLIVFKLRLQLLDFVDEHLSVQIVLAGPYAGGQTGANTAWSILTLPNEIHFLIAIVDLVNQHLLYLHIFEPCLGIIG